MLLCTPMYVTKIERKKGVMTVRKYPPPIKIYRQDYRGKQAAKKIQDSWRVYKLSHPRVYIDPGFTDSVDGAFSHMHGYYPNLCATKIQAVFRGHRVRKDVPMKRMVHWIVDNLL